MRFKDAESYYLGRANELKIMCRSGTPWVFLCASTFLEYLAKLVYENYSDRKDYFKFIRSYLAKIRPLYKDFNYKKNKKQDLPEQMYFILRCGIAHSFSFYPDKIGNNIIGRKQSIVLGHRKNCKQRKLTHLSYYSSKKIKEAALFIAEDFIDDIKKLAVLIFEEAKSNRSLKNNIKNRLIFQLPILGNY